MIKEGGTYYRFTKDEGGGAPAAATSSRRRPTRWWRSTTWPTRPGTRPTRSGRSSLCIGKAAGTSAGRGPDGLQGQPRRHLRLAVLPVRRRVRRPRLHPARAPTTWNPELEGAGRYTLPASPRHGTVLPVTQAELDAPAAGVPQPLPANDGRADRALPADGGDTGTTSPATATTAPAGRRRDLRRRQRSPSAAPTATCELPDNADGRAGRDDGLGRGLGRSGASDAVLHLGPGQHRPRAPATATCSRTGDGLPRGDRLRQLDDRAERHQRQQPAAGRVAAR